MRAARVAFAAASVLCVFAAIVAGALVAIALGHADTVARTIDPTGGSDV